MSLLGDIFSPITKGLFGTTQGTVPYTNQTSPWAPAQPYLMSGLQSAQSIFNNHQPDLTSTNAARSFFGNTLAGNYLTPDSNPYLKSSVQDALGLAGSAFAGQYGGPAGMNLGNSGYQEGLARTLGQVATNAYSNSYGQERQNQMTAASAAPMLDTTVNQAPWMGLQNYMGAISPALQFGTQQGQQPYYQNNTSNTLGTLIGGATLGKMFGFL